MNCYPDMGLPYACPTGLGMVACSWPESESGSELTCSGLGSCSRGISLQEPVHYVFWTSFQTAGLATLTHFITNLDRYTRHAAIIGSSPNFAIFRRFMPLRAFRLLYLSADSAPLADELGVQVGNDRNSRDPEKVLFESYYRKLHASRHNIHRARQVEL